MDRCLSLDQMERLLDEQLDPQQRETVGDHVEDCLSCQERLGGLVAAKHPAPARLSPDADAGASSSVVGFMRALKAQGPPSGLFRREKSGLGWDESNPASWAELDEARGAALPRRLPVITGFDIVREIGRGGMGVVYEATELALGRRVALKVLPAQMLTDPWQVRRFEREARSAAKLHHTNIVPVFGVGEHDGTHFYVMQFIEGQGLDAVLEELKKARDSRFAEGAGLIGWELTDDSRAGTPPSSSPAAELTQFRVGGIDRH